MNYLFWDTERIRNTKIYMAAVILTDENLNIICKERAIDRSIDVSSRTAPRKKVEDLLNDSLIYDDFSNFSQWLLNYLKVDNVICFGEEDYRALNDQLKIHNINPIEGKFYNLVKLIYDENLEGISNLEKVSNFLKVKHDAHDPLSDSYVTLELFKYLRVNFDMETAIQDIPIPNNILDIEVNGSYYNKDKTKKSKKKNVQKEYKPRLKQTLADQLEEWNRLNRN